jgi:hypothetical protein
MLAFPELSPEDIILVRCYILCEHVFFALSTVCEVGLGVFSREFGVGTEVS